MAEDRIRDRERDLVLSPAEYCFIQDQTKGHIDVYVGPFKTSLAATDVPVIFSEKSKRFEKRSLEEAISPLVTAPEGFYTAIKNPEKVSNRHPAVGSRSTTPDLEVGRKINLPGPVSFAPWPGQMAKILRGHRLRSNQYLLVRVYDEEAARKNWQNAVVKPQATPTESDGETKQLLSGTPDIVMGKLFVIKGTDVSFYIPPTGVEVLADTDSPGKSLVRDAVTLERLEYCLLLDQDGNKRYVQGPAVVFPKPTEEFVSKNVSKKDTERLNIRKFKAIELSESSGIYIKVIADYVENGKNYKTGDEIFITGKEQTIYFPRDEHAIIKYGTQEIHYGIAIPAGEARYVLNRNTGVIRLVAGPIVFLPDPRTEVIVHRILDPKFCELMYPNNGEALQHNISLLAAGASADSDEVGAVVYNSTTGILSGSAISMQSKGYVLPDAQANKSITLKSAASRGFSGDAFDRNTKYTKPRTVTLNTKYDGAVSMDVWTGYTVKLVRKNGAVRVVSGPQTVMLEYDEAPQVIGLSTGKPKTTDSILKTVYLKTTANVVSDIIEIETKDLCRLAVRVVYRVNFEGDNLKWFDVDNYVKYLTDNMRSRIRNAAMSIGIEQFYSGSTDIIRDVVLGKSVDGKRPGTVFSENGMRVYDVEVLGVKMTDAEVEKALVTAQRDVIGQTLVLAAQRRSLEHAKEIESIKQARILLEQATRAKEIDVKLADLEKSALLDLRKVEIAAEKTLAEGADALEAQTLSNAVEAKKLEAFKADKELKLSLEEKLMQQRLVELKANVDAMAQKAQAISPDFIAALQAFGDKALIEKVSQSMAPLAILGGDNVVEVLRKLLEGTELSKYLTPKK